jgi:hypothetical protein
VAARIMAFVRVYPDGYEALAAQARAEAIVKPDGEPNVSELIRRALVAQYPELEGRL